MLAVYEKAALKGWVIPCICTENLTTTEAIIAAAAEYAREHGMERIPVTLAITNQYDHRSQSVFYTHTRRWDVGLELFYADAKIISDAYPEVDLLLHLDHAQYDSDAGLLESDLSRFSSVMYDASALPLEENIRLTAAYVARKGDEIMIEGACDEIVDATGTAHNDITDAAKCEDYFRRTGVDMVVANLGTEHRASGKNLHYYGEAARAIKDRIGPRICLHGTSSVSNDEIKALFNDGIAKVNIWTALERDSSPALTEWMVRNACLCGGPGLEKKLVSEGILTENSLKGEPISIKYFTTTARQEIIYNEMKRIVKGYFELWYK
ncbi:MAG: class II fructose-bisphosphate aldolase [Bacteroidales bacterium]|nr:class II fructose-bisphosphate aldolase [Bacteroidales bacterium]